MPKSWKNTYTLVPSVTGLGDAGPLTFCKRPSCARGTSRCQRIFPVCRSRQMTNSFSFVCAVTKMRLLVNTGDECPAGNSVFQTTFLVGPNSVGKPFVSETPVPFGPRNCDHSSDAATVKGNVITRANRSAMFFNILETPIR